VNTYGTPENPFPELPPAASFYSVHWAGGAILITRPGSFRPVMISPACPPALASQGSWVSWYYAPPGDLFIGDGTGGLPESGSSFDFHITPGMIDPYWDGEIVSQGDALFSRVRYASSDNSQLWTVRPVDSWTIVHRVELEPDDFVVMADVGLMPYEQWHCVMMSWVAGGATSFVYDDVVQAVGFEPYGFGAGIWDGTYQDDAGAIAPAPERLGLMSGEGGHYDWWLSTEVIDFSNEANRRRFIDADLKPVLLGADGALGSPTGRAPEFFFHPGKTLEAFTNNRGTGGAVRWTDEAGMYDGYFIDPVWTQMAKPAAAGTGAP